MNSSYIVVKLGLHDFTNLTERTKDFTIEQMWIHPDYERATHHNDIALLLLNKKAAFAPICLPPTSEKYENAQKGVVAGWGRTESAATSDVVKKVTLDVLKNEVCKYSFNTKDKQQITSTILCAYKPGHGSCDGDSGGPLMCQPNYQREICGIVSLSPRCGSPLLPGLYTRVTEYIGWIRKTVENANTESG